MTKGRDMAADSLGDILEAARLKQRSGMLRVECSLEGRLEEGEVYLSTGQPIYARAGRLVGIDALNYLISWRNIHFAFVTDVLRPPMNIFTATRQSSVTTPLNWRPSNITPPHLPVTGGLRWGGKEPTRTEGFPAFPPGGMSRMEPMVPHKSEPDRDIISLGLTRRQRLIYFLIDGQRTVGDLARTTNKTVLETEVVINELQELGLIHF